MIIIMRKISRTRISFFFNTRNIKRRRREKRERRKEHIVVVVNVPVPPSPTKTSLNVGTSAVLFAAMIDDDD